GADRVGRLLGGAVQLLDRALLVAHAGDRLRLGLGLVVARALRDAAGARDARELGGRQRLQPESGRRPAPRDAAPHDRYRRHDQPEERTLHELAPSARWLRPVPCAKSLLSTG